MQEFLGKPFRESAQGYPKDTLPSTKPTLGLVLQYLSSRLGILGNIAIGNTDFSAVLSDLSPADNSITTAVNSQAELGIPSATILAGR
jgi:hypothetical protein